MKKKISIPVVVLKTVRGYNAFSPAVNGCAATGKTIDSVLARFREALEFHLEGEQLVRKFKTASMARRVLAHAFREYGVDVVYATVRVAA